LNNRPVMKIYRTELDGVCLLRPDVFKDERGVFLETYNRERHRQNGLEHDWVQDNLSSSRHGVVRGLHYQLGPHAQSKIVQAVWGRILDVVVDIRKGSPTFGRHVAVELDSEERVQILIPRGFAHGFSVLSESAVVMYKTDDYYHKASESGIRYDDPGLGIDWRIPADQRVVSSKDLELPLFSQLNTNFEYGA
jgi:dTDP-4-dehydrorhamnose 3,5-epimerase